MSRALALYDFVEHVETHQRGRIFAFRCSVCDKELAEPKEIGEHAFHGGVVEAKVKLFVGVETYPVEKLEPVK